MSVQDSIIQPRHCEHCKKAESDAEKLKHCKKCKSAFYCSRKCQRSRWKIHKAICKSTSVVPEIVIEAEIEAIRTCNYCKKEEVPDHPLKKCVQCKAVTYCNENCQRADWKQHKCVCVAINYLETKEVDDQNKKLADHQANAEKQRVQNSMFKSMNPKTRHTTVKLIGQKCVVNAKLNDNDEECLYDTGAQACIVDYKWVKDHNLIDELRNMDEFLDEKDIVLKAANQVEIPYKGWIAVDLKMTGWNEDASMNVPFLVTNDEIGAPIIGTNVIEEIIKKPDEYHIDPNTLLSSLQNAFQAPQNSVESFVKAIQESRSDICDIKTVKKNITVRRGSNMLIECRAKTGPITEKTPVLFEPSVIQSWPEGIEVKPIMLTVSKSSSKVSVPVVNNTSRDIVIPSKTLLGRIEAIRSITPLEAKLVEDSNFRNGEESTC